MIIQKEKDALTQAYITDKILYHSAKWVEEDPEDLTEDIG